MTHETIAEMKRRHQRDQIDLIHLALDKSESVVEAAKRLGIDRGIMYRYMRRFKIDRGQKPVALPIAALDRLATPAERRGISVNELVRRIVETVADENIIDAVLDDGTNDLNTQGSEGRGLLPRELG